MTMNLMAQEKDGLSTQFNKLATVVDDRKVIHENNNILKARSGYRARPDINKFLLMRN